MPLLLALLALLYAGLWPVAAREFTFACYNVENYAPLIEKGQKKPRKNAEATQALHEVIAALNADILGVCEMGGPEQFEEFKRRLGESELGYAHFEYVDGGDPDRHLALASRFPIVASQSRSDLVLESDFSHERLRRGLLDVTIAVTPEFQVRCIGVHLKSKLAGMEDAEFIRRMEARLVRKHIDTILRETPESHLLLYGDFNDSKTSPALREVAGIRGSKHALLPIRLSDANGEYWTHFWAANDSYSRIDYILVNRPLGKRVERTRCFIYNEPHWVEASDHRPLVVTFK